MCVCARICLCVFSSHVCVWVCVCVFFKHVHWHVQGYLWKKGQIRRNWTERWFKLRPSALTYYVSEDCKECKGSIALDHNCCVEVGWAWGEGLAVWEDTSILYIN